MRSDVGTGEWVWIKDRINIILYSQPNITDSSSIYPKCAGGAQCQCQASETWSLLRVNWQGVGIIWVRREMIKKIEYAISFNIMVCQTPKVQNSRHQIVLHSLLQAYQVTKTSIPDSSISCRFLKYKLVAQGDLSDCPCWGQSPFNPLCWCEW